jgi:protein phosphatase 1G
MDMEVIFLLNLTLIGPEASKFVANHFKSFLISNAKYAEGNYEQALKETFLKMDEIMAKPNARREIESFAT